ncbi:MAG TPA: PQQ-binding-like beta-propeller repeat protein, partial [Candidatus Sulfotelmatobacter sp.]|nr:PQQ-binding-like beta-propeller repeat protein [Candidatus Sulfotelmatobacter sp.]
SYFRHLSQRALGVYFLLGGAGVFIVAIAQLSRGRKQLPLLLPKLESTGPTARMAKLSRWSVAASGIFLGALLFSLSLGLTTPLPNNSAQIDKLLGTEADTGTAAAVPDAASPEELKLNWPSFRGVSGGFSLLTNVPATWDAKTGAGIAWKTAAPTSGFNSPVVWGNRVFFSGGDAEKREVFCLDGKSGQLLWRQAVANVPGSPAQAPEIPESTGYAASTMATDGRRVYVMFANGDVAALTLEGKPVWSKGFGALKNTYGYANSLCTWQDRLIIQLDQGDSEEGKSKLYALDGRTGKVVWQQPRKVGASWASPMVIEAAGKPQIIVLSVPWAIAYSATDGKELWRVECLNGEVTPSPAFAGGFVLVASPSEKLLAIRPDGQGDVTKTHVAWFNEDNVPDVTSPASNGELVFTVTTSGLLSCFDLKDGKKQWEHDLDMECHASPVMAGNRVYLFSQKGRVVVVEAARQYKELFRTEMEDGFHATPAFGPNGMVLRGLKDIWCVGEKK